MDIQKQGCNCDEKTVKNFIRLTKKKMKRNEIGSCLLQNTVKDIYDCFKTAGEFEKIE